MPWWARKARQLRLHLFARVTGAEHVELEAWLRQPELALFHGMHRADQRHGLDVAAYLRVAGVGDRDILAAALLHDCGKGDTGAGPRVAWSLGERYGNGVLRAASLVPGWRAPLERLRTHAEVSAQAVAGAGLPPRAVALVREQADPHDVELGALFHAADEAS